MSKSSGLSVYNYLSEVYGNELTDELAERVHAGMENPDLDFQRQREKMIEMSSSGRVRKDMLVYAYRLFRKSLSDNFFGGIKNGCLVDLSGIDAEKRKEFFKEIVNQFIESESGLSPGRSFEKLLREQPEYMWEVFEAAFSDLKIINIAKIVKRKVDDVVEE
jgi:hypothetical protein